MVTFICVAFNATEDEFFIDLTAVVSNGHDVGDDEVHDKNELHDNEDDDDDEPDDDDDDDNDDKDEFVGNDDVIDNIVSFVWLQQIDDDDDDEVIDDADDDDDEAEDASFDEFGVGYLYDCWRYSKSETRSDAESTATGIDLMWAKSSPRAANHSSEILVIFNENAIRRAYLSMKFIYFSTKWSVQLTFRLDSIWSNARLFLWNSRVDRSHDLWMKQSHLVHWSMWRCATDDVAIPPLFRCQNNQTFELQ